MATRNKKSGRGSAEAIEKRRVARRLNVVLAHDPTSKLDGRTARRCQRLIKSLGDRTVKPAAKLLALHEIRSVDPTLLGGVKPVVFVFRSPEDMAAGKRLVAKMGRLHGFRPATLGRHLKLKAA